jgi:hypothetical protein
MTDKPVRVLRLMEYIYPDIETATQDMARWQVQGTYKPRQAITIRSTVLPPEVWESNEKPDTIVINRNTDPTKEQDLKTPEQWAVEHRVHIMVADGWRSEFTGNDGVHYGIKDVDEPITETEFIQRLALCTQGPSKDLT